MDINLTISDNLRQLRKERGLSLDAAAELTGVSRSRLAQIEKGSVNPTISVLWKIANGLKVSLSRLWEPQQQTASLLRADAQPAIVADDGRYSACQSFPLHQPKLFEFYRICIQSGGASSPDKHLEGTEEYVTVFSGAVEVELPDARYTLQEGDSLHFRADVPHRYYNPFAEPVTLAMVLSYTDIL